LVPFSRMDLRTLPSALLMRVTKPGLEALLAARIVLAVGA